MENGERRTNYEQLQLPGDSAQIFLYIPHFLAKASLMENNCSCLGQCVTIIFFERSVGYV
jgi:hypothetical protein